MEEQLDDGQQDDGQQDDGQQDGGQLEMEESILSIINKIKKDRNRACVQNIHTFINRRGINIEAEKVKKGH